MTDTFESIARHARQYLKTPNRGEPMKPHRLHVPSREGDLDGTLRVRDGFDISVFAALPGTLRW